MSFLDRFTTEHRQLFESEATVLDVPKGQYLLRRGEPGGDVYVIQAGSLEVVDNRTTPEVILTVLEEGAVVGEMAFVDDSPRSADVRAGQDAQVLRWARDDLRALLSRQPVLASEFFQSVARLASDRIRALTSHAISGALTRTETRSAAGLAHVRDEARRIAENAKEGFLETETRLRQDPMDQAAQQRVKDLLDRLQEEVRILFTSNKEIEAGQAAARILCRELHPYLVRSSLAERCIRRQQGASGTAEVLSHVLVDTAGGDGQMGELLDRWLLDRPMLKALRRFREPTLELVQAALPRHRNRRLLIVNAATGSLVASLAHAVSQLPTVITVVDQSREALAFLHAGLSLRPRAVELNTVQENLAGFAMGRHRNAFPLQDVVLLHGLVEYMPDRIAVSMLSVARQLLAPHGTVIVCAVGPSDDEELLDWVLSWPTVRRTREATQRLFAAAGMIISEEPELYPPALIFAGRSPDTPATVDSGQTPLADGRPSA
jgi:CRP-like cAMP-binding protein